MRIIKLQAENCGDDQFSVRFEIQHSEDATDQIVPELRRCITSLEGTVHRLDIQPHQRQLVWHGMTAKVEIMLPHVVAVGAFLDWLCRTLCVNPEPPTT